MKKWLSIYLLIIFIIAACQKTEIPESYLNETCKEKGYDFALPIYTDEKIVGFNCCTEIDEHTAECLDYHLFKT
jgi:hypothetical protein